MKEKPNKAIIRLKNDEINREKWDNCIRRAPNTRIYAFAWYLDITCYEWEGLIYGDYEFVMPLTVVNKFMIKALLRPPFSQQLGIFPIPCKSVSDRFMEQVQAFKLINYPFNSKNKIENVAYDNPNFLLPLLNSYQQLESHFSSHCRRHLRKGKSHNLQVINTVSVVSFIEHLQSNVHYKVTPKSLLALHRIISYAMYWQKGQIFTAYNKQNQLSAAAFIVRSANRLYFLAAFSTPEGKKNSAMYAVVRHIIKMYSGSGLILDFEGSVQKGVARFYEGFGAYAESYSVYEKNNHILGIKRVLTNLFRTLF